MNNADNKSSSKDTSEESILDETLDETKRRKGKITSIKQEKGFGFIECTEDGRDYFFHHSEVLRGSISFKGLKGGMTVSFFPLENEDIRKGPVAKSIMLALP